MRLASIIGVFLAATACEPPVLDEPWPTSEGLAACTDALGAECKTFRALTGASMMGGGAAARVAFTHPELFDTVGIMGTPLLDLPAMWSMLRENQLGGFCDLATLESGLAAQGAAFVASESSFCGAHDTALDAYPDDFHQVSATDAATPDGACAAFRSDFNHWYRGPDAGRGAPFTRNDSVDILADLIAAYGNPLTSNGAFLTRGLDPEWRPTPASTSLPRACVVAGQAVPRIEGVVSREHNPDGTYDAIPFCDGSASVTGNWSAVDTHDKPIGFALAVDLDGDGARDLGEPVIRNDRERFLDEDGDRERDLDEPFDDDGLDGVPGTGDLGEGNGAFDESPGLAQWRARSPTTLYASMSDTQVERVSVWMDAGVRDFMNSAQITNRLFDLIASRTGELGFYQGFASLVDVHVPSLPRVSYLQYGDPSVCPASDPVGGDGNHAADVDERTATMLAVAAARMPEDDRRDAIEGDVASLVAPLEGATGTMTDFLFVDSFDSGGLGRASEFGVVLPPDYFVDAKRRYPVLYVLHGQGSSPADMLAVAEATWTSMKESTMQRAIIVFPDGRCVDDACFTGTFYANFANPSGLDRPQFESALYELMRTVEARYRTLAPR